MKTVSIQIQTVLYCNHREELIRSMDSIARAIELSGETDMPVKDAALCYGDASPYAVFSADEAEALAQRYRRNFALSYRVFGFNSGTAKGHNLLAEGSSADYLLLMNPDLVFSPRTLIDLLRPFSSAYGPVGLVEARQTPVEHPKEYDPVSGDTSWASGACSLVPAALFRELNGYDADSFFMYCDDVDLSWRARLNGYRIVYQPRSPVYHAKRFSAQGKWATSAAERYDSAKAALILAHKWSHPELVEKLMGEYRSGRDELHRQAVQTFLQRKAQGELPACIDADHRVGEFHGYDYARHRFTLQ